MIAQQLLEGLVEVAEYDQEYLVLEWLFSSRLHFETKLLEALCLRLEHNIEVS
jgi:hypothetical protein